MWPLWWSPTVFSETLWRDSIICIDTCMYIHICIHTYIHMYRRIHTYDYIWRIHIYRHSRSPLKKLKHVLWGPIKANPMVYNECNWTKSPLIIYNRKITLHIVYHSRDYLNLKLCRGKHRGSHKGNRILDHNENPLVGWREQLRNRGGHVMDEWLKGGRTLIGHRIHQMSFPNLASL